MFDLLADVTSVATSTATVTTAQPGLIAVFRHFVAAFFTDWVHTWRYTEGLALLLQYTLLDRRNNNKKLVQRARKTA